jgi:hypothetical protein
LVFIWKKGFAVAISVRRMQDRVLWNASKLLGVTTNVSKVLLMASLCKQYLLYQF